MLERVREHVYRLEDDTYGLAPGSYDPADEASIIAAINTMRDQIASGPPPQLPPPPSGEARQARRLKKLMASDPTAALLLKTGLKK